MLVAHWAAEHRGHRPATQAEPAATSDAYPAAGLASGLLGAGIGIGVLAGAAAGTLFFLRRKRQGAADGLAEHDLARSHDSVVITKKKKKRASAAVPSAFIVQGARNGCCAITRQIFITYEQAEQAGPPAPCKCRATAQTASSYHLASGIRLRFSACVSPVHDAGAGTGQDEPGADDPAMPSSPRQVRMVAFAEGTGSELSDEDKQRLRAANIQDSVVIIRNRMASGQLPSGQLSSHKLDIAHGSEHSWSSGEDEVPCADPEDPAPAATETPAQDPVEHVSTAEGARHHLHHVVHVEPHSALHQPQLQHSPSKRVQFSGAVPAVVLDP